MVVRLGLEPRLYRLWAGCLTIRPTDHKRGFCSPYASQHPLHVYLNTNLHFLLRILKHSHHTRPRLVVRENTPSNWALFACSWMVSHHPVPAVQPQNYPLQFTSKVELKTSSKTEARWCSALTVYCHFKSPSGFISLLLSIYIIL